MTIDPYAIQNIGIPMKYPSERMVGASHVPTTAAAAVSATAAAAMPATAAVITPAPAHPATSLSSEDVTFLQTLRVICNSNGIYSGRDLIMQIQNGTFSGVSRSQLINLEARLDSLESRLASQAPENLDPTVRQELNDLRERLNNTIPNYGAF